MLLADRYEVFNNERAMDALNVIWERKEKLEVVLTNVHRTDASEFGIIQRIEKECKLQIILMSPDPDDNMKIVSSGLGTGATLYIVKSLSMNEINNLWADALAREKGKVMATEAVGSALGEEIRGYQKRKRKEIREISEENEGSKDDSTIAKKPRVVWTKEMHQKFLEAIAQLGHERAFPKKIVEIMNVPGLTRENVASHLQKYRMCLKRAQEGFTSPYGMSSINDVKDPCFPSMDFQGNSRQSHWTKFQRLRGTLSIPSYGHCGFNHSMSKIRPFHTSYIRNISSFDAVPKQNTEDNFRVYGDQTKNILLSIASGNAKQTESCNVNKNFIGFRLAGDGKSVEFGQTGISSENGIGKEMVFSPARVSGDVDYSASIFDNSIPVTQLQQQSIPPFQATKNENSALWTKVNESFDYYPSMPVSFNGIWNENSDQYPWTPVSSTQQQCSLSPLETNGNDNSDTYCSAFADCISPNQPSVYVPHEEASLPPLQVQELDSFGGEDDFLMGNTTRSFSEYFADILYNRDDQLL